jgi:hypothetical protein
MKTKLTLHIDEELIQAAQAYADRRNTSVSQIVARYFELLSQENGQDLNQKSAQPNVLDLPPITASLYGMLERKNVDLEDYRKHLEEKYSR